MHLATAHTDGPRHVIKAITGRKHESVIRKKRKNGPTNTQPRFQTNSVPKLSMDHVHMSFIDFMWCSFFVLPPMALGALIGGPKSSGIYGLLRNRFLRNLGLMRRMDPEAEAEKALVELCLNSSMATWITDITKSADDNEVFGTVSIPNMTHITKFGTVNSGTLRLIINFSTQTLAISEFQGAPIKVHDCLAILFNAFAGHSHPLVHCFANWGINPNAADPFIRRMSLITIQYNNMGFESYSTTMQFFRDFGVANYIDHDTSRLTTHVNHNFPNHAHLSAGIEHSEYLRFIFMVRARFLSEFGKYAANDFAGIDAEALFIGTVIHSIDHRQAVHCINVSNFTPADERFAADHEWAKVTFNCFTDRPPGRLFDCRFAHAQHPFFRNIYKYASSINPRLASYLEACIAM